MSDTDKPAGAFVFAECTTALGWGGRTIYLHEGQVWDARDPLVSARPELFLAEPRTVYTSVDRSTLNTEVGESKAPAGKPRREDTAERKPRSRRG